MKKKKNITWRLAVTGIKKNSKLYLPYVLAGIVMIAVFYILLELGTCSLLKDMRAGTTLGLILRLGVVVMGVFSISMLIYTNSFLIKSRIREFGLYNILGMDRKNIAGILVAETVITGTASIVGGIAVGLLLSKLAEAFLAKLVKRSAEYSLNIDVFSIGVTVMVFIIFFVFVMLMNVIRISRRNTIDLLKNDRLGEKPPKARYFMAFLGLVILGTAYYMAVSITDPIGAMTYFFMAVILVIVGTMLLFITGSVTLCRLLQKKKGYYYKTKHFVSLSSMIFRMKRNGVGLAEICILSTMVLVMIASSSCLYFGQESLLKEKYPRDHINEVVFYPGVSDEYLAKKTDEVKRMIGENVLEKGLVLKNPVEMKYKGFTCWFDNGEMHNLSNSTDVEEIEKYTDISWDVLFVSLEDFNSYMGTDETLADDEAICCEYYEELPYDAVSFIEGGQAYSIKKRVGDFYNIGISYSSLPKVVFIVNELPVMSFVSEDGLHQDPELVWSYNFDYEFPDGLVSDDFTRMEMDGFFDVLSSNSELIDEEIMYWRSNDKNIDSDDFYYMYGGLFFIGIVLSLVFICALGLMIYYKQISEGYEDRSRFEIMQKVGMTERDIRSSINSQMSSVFYIPLAVAVIHLAFAFPMIYRCLKLFDITNFRPLLITSLISVALFAAIYAVIYRITSNSYYKLVK